MSSNNTSPNESAPEEEILQEVGTEEVEDASTINLETDGNSSGFFKNLIAPLLNQDEDPEKRGALSKKGLIVLLGSGVLVLLLALGGVALRRKFRVKEEPFGPKIVPKPYDFPPLQSAAKELREEAYTWYSPAKSQAKNKKEDYMKIADDLNNRIYDKFRANFFGALPQQSKQYREKLYIWDNAIAPFVRAADMSVLEDSATRFRTLRSYIATFHKEDADFLKFEENKPFVYSKEKLKAKVEELRPNIATVSGTNQKVVVGTLFVDRSDIYFALRKKYIDEYTKAWDQVVKLHVDIAGSVPDLVNP